MERENNPTNGDVNPKVPASAAGGGVGVAVGEILVYLAERFGGDLPAGIEAAVVIVAAAALSFVAGYVRSDNRQEQPLIEDSPLRP